MTPGFAKTREEMPWLPYRTPDVQVINAHNFGGGVFSPAVNGKMPVAAWIPSRDTAGNGTTTLTDLAGSNNGTLTNMNPATDWVADTDAGGVRALNFPDSSDRVTAGTSLSLTTSFSVSVWCLLPSFVSVQTIISKDDAGTDRGWNLNRHLSAGKWRFLLSPNGSSVFYRESASNAIAGSWQHVVGVYNSTALTLSVYVNGSLDNGTLVNTVTSSIFDSTAVLTLGAVESGASSLFGRLDDLRIWGQAIDATDVTDLYASGIGRGVNVA